MTSNTDTLERTRQLEEHLAAYVRAFNAGDADTLNAMYTDEAVAVWEPGKPLTGQARKDYVAAFLARGATMETTIRESYVTSDTALMIVDWSMETTDDDGAPLHLQGTGVDVLTLGADGAWRYAIDDAHGEPRPSENPTWPARSEQ